MSIINENFNRIGSGDTDQPNTGRYDTGVPQDEAMIALLEHQAHELASRAKWGAAARALLRVARVEPHNTERWLQIAQWQRQDHNVKAAAKTLQTALRLTGEPAKTTKGSRNTGTRREAPQAPPATQKESSIALWLALAETQMEAQAWDECIKACQELLTLAPDHHLGQEIMATALLYNGQIEESITIMRRLLQLSPRDPLHRLKLATLLHLGGNLGDSLREFQRVVSTHPDAPFAQEAYETIEALDRVQIQQILARAADDTTFRVTLQRNVEAALAGSEYYLSDGGHESLRHLLWDGRIVEDPTAPPPVIH